MRALVSFCGCLHEHLGDDRRWLGLVEGEPGDLSFELLPFPPGNTVGDPALGGLGLARWGDKVVSALQWHQPTFAVFNGAMRFERAVEQPAVKDVHSIAVHGDRLYVASTGNNRLVTLSLPAFDVEGTPLAFGPDDENRCHLNSVAVGRNGQVLVAYHRDPLSPDAKATIRHVCASPSSLVLGTEVRRLHSLAVDGFVGYVAYCDSFNNRAWVGDGWIETAGYARGLAFTDDHVLAGSSWLEGDGPGPAVCAVEMFDRDGERLDGITIAERWEIYDILILEE